MVTETEKLNQRLAEKDSAIAELSDKLVQESAEFTALEKQHHKMVNECSKNLNTKQQQIDNLKTTLTTVQDEVCV